MINSIFFVLPALIYGKILTLFSDKSNPRRTFLTSAENMTIIFIGLYLSGFSEVIFLLLTGIMFSINVIGFAGINMRTDILPILVPLLYFGPVFSTLHFSESFIFPIYQIIPFLGIGIGSNILVYLNEKIFQTAVPVSPVELFSNFLNKEKMNLDLGVETDILLQRLLFKNGKKLIFCLPWIHPGPLRNIGGGAITRDIIEGVNEDSEDDTQGFFWHVPSFHDVDVCNYSTSQDILDECSLEEPEYLSKSTKILENDDSEFELHGQRIGDNYIIFLKIEGADDYETEIFQEIREKTGEKIAFVDTHQLQPNKQGALISKKEKIADEIQEKCTDFLEKLENAEAFEIEAGFGISEEKDMMTLVEEIGGEKFLIVGMDRNGIPDSLRKDLKKFEDDYDKVISLTTDSHRTMEFLDSDEGLESPDFELAERAEENLEPVQVGLEESWLENVRVMGKDFHKFYMGVGYSMFYFSAMLVLLYLTYLISLI